MNVLKEIRTEFKTGSFAVDQTLANMLCTAADGSVEILKQGKQINIAIVYGLSVNYEIGMAQIRKLTLDFERNLYEVVEVKHQVTLMEAINFMVHHFS